MPKQKPPTSGELCAKCPSPDIVAKRKDHFGRSAWEFECNDAKQVFLESKGIVIHCGDEHQRCGVDDGRDYFVSSPKISPIKNFLEASMKFLNR